VADKLTQVLATVLELSPEQIRDDLTPNDVEVWDSFTHVMLMTNLEEAFGITIDPSEATKVSSVGKIRSMLRRRGIEV
jgi:acyl carrier protein